MIPITAETWSGPTPPPVQAPPATGLEDVTNGIGPVVEVEERPLGSLEEHVVPGSQRVLDEGRRVGDQLAKAGRPS